MTLLMLACVEVDRTPPVPFPEDTSCVDAGVDDISAELTDIGTVIRVRWTTDEDVVSYVSYSTPSGTRNTPSQTGEVHEALLIGNAPVADVSWRIVTDAGESCTRTSQTGALLAGLPSASVSGDPAEGPGLVVTPILQEEATALAILDNYGDYVWAWAPEDADKATSFFGAELALDGSAILFNTGARSDSLPGPIYRVGLDGTLMDPILVNGAHTDFVQLPDGGYGVLAWEIQAIGNRRFLGDTIVEVTADGATRTVWSVWDDYTPDLTRTWSQGWYPGDAAVEDWSHINGIAYDAATERYLVTASFNESVLMIDRSSGELEQVLGPDGGDWQSAERLLDYPHSVQAVDGGVLVFNRGDIYSSDSCSEAVEIDLSSETAEPTWVWASDACTFVPFLGSAHRLSDGSTFVDWTTAGQLDRVSPEASLLWRLNLELGGGFGFAQVIDPAAL